MRFRTHPVLRFTGSLLLGATLLALRPAALPDPYRVEQLAPGVYAVVRKVPTTGASDSNVLFIINDDDVVVVDANIFPSSAREVIREIRKLTRKPVRYLVNTHWHSDHHYGNEEYVKAWPGVQIISHPRTRELIVNDDIPSLARNVSTEYPAEIARLEKVLATGKGSSGTPLTDAVRKDVSASLALYRFFLTDVRGMRQQPATMTVADSMLLHRGDRTIVIKWLGRGNTPGDLIVWLPKERVVATGDLVVSPIPFGFGSFVSDWPETLRKLKELGPATIMPGHGHIMTDWRYVDQLIPLFESVWDQTSRAVSSGANLDSTRKLVKLDSFRDEFAGTDASLRSAFDGLFAFPIVEATFNQLRPDSTRKN